MVADDSEVDVDNLVIGSRIVPNETRVATCVGYRVLPYRGEYAGLVHRVFFYASWIGLDCSLWRSKPFNVRDPTTVITCFWCIVEAVECGH